jgi:K+-transporting ATPase KdpF subunit
MDWTLWLSLGVAVGLGCYLVVALVKPEWFA